MSVTRNPSCVGDVRPVTIVTDATATLSAQDSVVIVRTNAATTITLPPVSAVVMGARIVVKNDNSNPASQKVTVTPQSGTIEGGSSKDINDSTARTYIFDGTNWILF